MADKLEIELQLKKFNWGAAYFGFMWSVVNGCFKKWFKCIIIASVIALISCLIAILITSKAFSGLSSVGFIFSFIFVFLIPILTFLVLFIYVGKKGNAWAWDADEYKEIMKFQKIQRRWGILAAVITILSIVSILVQVLFIGAVSKMPSPTASAKSNTYVSKEVCKTVYKNLPNAISGINTNDEEWISKVADKIKNDDEGLFAFGLDYNKQLHVSMFNKESLMSERGEFEVVKDSPCNFSEANCYITAKTSDPNYACKFYFDDNGKVATSKKTENFIK